MLDFTKVYITEEAAKEAAKAENSSRRTAHYINTDALTAVTTDIQCVKVAAIAEGYKVEEKEKPTAASLTKSLAIIATETDRTAAQKAYNDLDKLIRKYTADKLDNKAPSNTTLKSKLLTIVKAFNKVYTVNSADIHYMLTACTTAKSAEIKVKPTAAAIVDIIKVKKGIYNGYSIIEKTTHSGKTSEGTTSEGTTSEGTTSEGKTSEGKTSEGKTSEGKTSEGKTA